MKPMQLGAFLASLDTVVNTDPKRSYCFFGPEGLEPVLFCSLLRELLKQKGFTFTTFAVDTQPVAHVYTTLSTSFLGQSSVYWLNNLRALPVKELTPLLAFLHEYHGPHQLFLYMQDLAIREFNDEWIPVEFPLTVDHALFATICSIFGKPLSAQARVLSQRLWARHKQVPLETACLLMHYFSVLGASSGDSSVQQFLDSLIDAKTSLFTLSSYFFAKQPDAFFKQWRQVVDEFQDIFWISFWTEQIWRAHYVVKAMKEKQLADAKKIGFRLPFSFLQRDWRLVSAVELQRAHQFLYEADFQLKNGGSSFCFDLFFTTFFTGGFFSKNR